MRLNLGCGKYVLPGWVNVDLYADSNVDVRCDLRKLTFDAGSCSEALASHVLEHFAQDEGLAICRDVFRFLRPGGEFVVEMPDRLRCVELIRMGLAKRETHGVIGVRRRVLNGTKGLLGGRMGDKDEWHRWLIEHAEAIVLRAEAGLPTVDLIPERYNAPGYPHLYVWGQDEFAAALQGIGFTTRIEEARLHGKRHDRDMRVVGVKP